MAIDWWTLTLQTINVLILIWILAKFFFRPVADIVAKRQAAAQEILAEATTTQRAAEAEKAAAEKLRVDIAADRDRLIAAAQQEAEAVKQHLIEEAKQEGRSLRAEAQSAIARAQAAAESALIDKATDLSVDIARRLVGRLPADTALETFLDELIEKIRALPSETKETLAAASKDQPLAVVTAAPLSKAESERITRTLSDALQTEPPLQFLTEPALIAGIELRGRNTVVGNSWRRDLDKIDGELRRGRQVDED